ncbi:dual specificity protein phosphatase family protein [soil metagenome]
MKDTSEVPIRNFHQVTEWLYRGGQPGSDGVKSLAELGVRTVISLRWGKKTIETEKTYVEAAGMRFLSVRLNYWNLPNQQIIDDFLRLVDHEASRPIFVHCLHGADRTGLLIAIYRMAKENWPVEKAYAEMKKYGFHRFRIRNFKWMLWRYARQAKEDGAIT